MRKCRNRLNLAKEMIKTIILSVYTYFVKTAEKTFIKFKLSKMKDTKYCKSRN